MNDLIYEEKTYEIIGIAMEIHRILGPGFLESVYEEAFVFEFKNYNIPFKKQYDMNVNYKSKTIGKFRTDFLVYDKIILELKAIKSLTEIDKAKTIHYLKATGMKLGLLINFGEPSLHYERLVY